MTVILLSGLLLSNFGVLTNYNFNECDEMFKPCYAIVNIVDENGNFIKKNDMDTCEAPRYTDCTSHVKKWLADLEVEGNYLQGASTSWGAPLSVGK